MPKKVPKSGYYLFMVDLQHQYAQKGMAPPPLKEMQLIAAPKWSALSPEEKATYNAKAKGVKAHGKITLEGKFTSDGIPILQLEAEMQAKEQETFEMKRSVQELVENLGSVNNVAEAEFIIMSFNILCRTDDYMFIPNELGLVKYSLSDGVKEKFHKFIDPGPIPVGYTSDAKEHSEKTHQIPIHAIEFEEFDRNYNGIYKEILRFVGVEQDETAMVFCLGQNLEHTAGCVDWLREKAWTQAKRQIYFADITSLLMELACAVDQPYSSETVAEDVLNQHSFDYSANTRCKFHEELDSAHCALAQAQKLSFIFSDALCSKYNIPVTDKHLPPRMTNSVMVETWQPKGPIKPVVNIVNVPLKPVREQPTTMLTYNARSKFGDYDDDVVVPSNMASKVSAPTASEPKEVPNLDDDKEFPSLSQKMKDVNLHNEVRPQLSALREPKIGLGRGNIWNLGRGIASVPPPGFSRGDAGPSHEYFPLGAGVGLGRGMRGMPSNAQSKPM